MGPCLWTASYALVARAKTSIEGEEMNRPCTCEQCTPGQPYTPDQCRVCWLYHNDSAYRTLWNSQEAHSRNGPCIHRGDLLREDQCPSCRGVVRLKVFACGLHTECTVARVLTGCACCANCPDFAAENAPPVNNA